MISKQRFTDAMATRRWIVYGAMIVLSALIVAASACGGMMGGSNTMAPAQGATASFAFVSNSNSGTVSAFAVSTSGALTEVSGSPFPAGSGVEFLAVDSVHKLLFTGNANAGSLSAFSINTGTGMLTAVPGSPFSTGGQRPEGVIADPMGRFVFVSNQASDSISVFSVGANGALTPVSGSPFTANNPFGLAVNPSGTVLYANNFPDSGNADLNTVSAFTIGSTGALTPVSGSPFPTANTASGFAASIGLVTDGQRLFVGDHMADAIVPFNINAMSGALTPPPALPTPPSSCGVSCHNNPLRLAVDPMDRFLYWTNVGSSTLSVFDIRNGAFSPIMQMATGANPRGLAVDPTGGFVFTVNKGAGTISGFAVNSMSGMLTPVAGSPFAENGSAPSDIVIVAKQ